MYINMLKIELCLRDVYIRAERQITQLNLQCEEPLSGFTPHMLIIILAFLSMTSSEKFQIY